MSRLALLTAPALLLIPGCDPHPDDDDNDCEPSSGTVCGEGTIEVDGECVPDFPEIICGPGTTEVNGECLPDGPGLTCALGTTEVNGECVPDVVCGGGTIDIAGECECLLGCGAGTSQVGDECLPDGGGLICGPDTMEFGGECLCSELCTDTDSDGVCDVIDPCPLDAPDDTDGDGTCDSDDVCPEDPDNDIDGDLICGNLDACPSDPLNGCARRVFVTSGTVIAPDLDSESRNDVCQDAAVAAGLAGAGSTFLAWYSDPAVPFSPATHFTQATVPYVRVDGVTVADDWADLTDNQLDNPINVDESGMQLTDSGLVFTQTFLDGSATGDSCLLTGDVTVGLAHEFSTDWTFAFQHTVSCLQIVDGHFYCFEQ